MTSSLHRPSVQVLLILVTAGIVLALLVPATSPTGASQDGTGEDGSPPTLYAGWFGDIWESPFRDDIVWLAERGVVAGCAEDRFCSTGSLTREQMASLLVRALQLPETKQDHFTDDARSGHQAAINALAQAGITVGCAEQRYCPGGAVTRGQAAAFLARALALPSASQDYFDDDSHSAHEESINRLAAAGITYGCAEGRFCPSTTVSREQAAALMKRGLTTDGGRRSPRPSPTPTPSSTPTPTPTPSSTPTPTPSSTPTPTPAQDHNVSGIHIPPPSSGYERVIFTEFPNAQPLGQPPHPDTARYLVPRPDIARDCTYNDSSGRGRYCWLATTSEHDGVLDQWLHTETGSCKSSGHTHVHDPEGGCNYVSGPKWNLPNQDEFIVSFVAKIDDIPGRKVAYLRWCGPKIGTSGYCEDNFPEAKLESGPRGHAFHHHESRTTKQSAQLNAELDQWHLYQMHVKPCQFVDFYLDGKLVLHATEYVTCGSSYWVGQAETYLGGQALPLPHRQGHILWDSFAVDLPAR